VEASTENAGFAPCDILKLVVAPEREIGLKLIEQSAPAEFDHPKDARRNVLCLVRSPLPGDGSASIERARRRFGQALDAAVNPDRKAW
jgi:hypothetical protein